MVDTSPFLSFAEQRARWGEAVDLGLVVVPSVLVRHRGRLGLSLVEQALLFNLIDAWIEEGELPSLSLPVLARRIGRDKRTIERAVVRLAGAGLLIRLPPEMRNGRTIRRFDLAGLIQKLAEVSRQEARVRLRSRRAA